MSCILHPASILRFIPHLAKPMLDPPDSWLTVSIDQNTGGNLFGSHLLPYPFQVWYHKGDNVLRLHFKQNIISHFQEGCFLPRILPLSRLCSWVEKILFMKLSIWRNTTPLLMNVGELKRRLLEVVCIILTAQLLY